jgi:membrane-bound PQQ-dependent dehydrogenase (glucose/quinate/shikimate family)
MGSSKRSWLQSRAAISLALGGIAVACAPARAPGGAPTGGSVAPTEWRSWGRDPGGNRFAPLTQIKPDNVSRLQPAWVYRTGDVNLRGRRDYHSGGRLPAFQATPLVIEGVMYLSTPAMRVIALEAETGREIWTFDPFTGEEERFFRQHRGVAYWEGTAEDGRRLQRILYGTSDGRLISLDAITGQRDPAFGKNGEVDLKADVGFPDQLYSVTSPPVIYRDLVIIGAEVPENPGAGPSGDVRAFHILTGEQAWRFHTVPRPGEPGHETWEDDSWRDRTGANVWSIMSVDAERGMVFLPTGSASYDFYGGDRKGKNLYANSLVALEAATGELIWYHQLVHHDLWDWDLPAQPILVDLRREGREIPAVVQLTKMGFVYAFDRVTGEPLFPIGQRAVPQSEVPGEATWPTQPFPVRPPPLVRVDPVTREEITTVTPESRAYCMELFEQAHSGGVFTPPGLELTIIFPGTLGGATWSGGSFDPRTQRLYVNVNEVGSYVRMVPQPPGSPHPYRRGGPKGEYGRFWDDNQLPCQEPPWGRLIAVDLARGEIEWNVPLGVIDHLLERGIDRATGAPNLGGSIVTAGGVVFVAGTNDRRFRAFDARTGEELWVTEMEASGHATPMTFMGTTTGKQYVVIAAGGGGAFSQRFGDTLVAFALPD